MVRDMLRDILLIFLLCVLLVYAASEVGRGRGAARHGGLLNPGNLFLSPSAPLKKPQKIPPQNIPRTFKWETPEKNPMETTLHIPPVALKREIRKFGVPHGTSNPFFMKKRGFRIIGQKTRLKSGIPSETYTTVIDYRRIFQRNLVYFKSLSAELRKSTGLQPGQDPLPYFLRFVQHIHYQLPPNYYKGKFINSFFVPLVLLFEQYGDCDSKALLLADFLAAGEPGEKIALVLIRGRALSHALLAVRRRPLPGMFSLHDFKKGYFIVLETTNPTWSPGFVSKRLIEALKAGLFHFVELN